MAEGELTERVLRGLAHGGVYARGQGYLAGGAVRQLQRAGSRVEAQVWGSYPQPYLTRLSLEPPFGYSCTCPYDGGGACKHVVAVGLAWLRTQGEETRDEPVPLSLGERLAELNVGELRELVMGVFDQVSVARPVVDRWLWRQGLWSVGGEPGAGNYRDTLARVGTRLDDLLDLARLNELWEEAAEDWTEEGRAAEDELDDFTGELTGLVRDVVELPPAAGFIAIPALELVCTRLAAADQEALDVADYWDRSAADAAAALAERLLAAGLAEAEAAAARERLLPLYQAGAGFLEPVLLTGSQDPEAARQLAATLGTLGGGAAHTGIKLLLEAQLAEDAERYAAEWGVQDDKSLLLLARHFRAAGSLDKAVSYYRRATRTRYPDRGALAELAEVYTAAGRLAEASEARVGVFEHTPSLEHWREAMTAAAAVGRRDEVKEELLGRLRRSGRGSVLCAILVAEAAVDPGHLTEAAQVAAGEKSPGLCLEVGKAALRVGGEAGRPLALNLFQEAAEELALQGNNCAYEKAAAVADLLREHFPDAWPGWFGAYLGRHRRRRNLLRELTAAGLYGKSQGKGD